MEPRIFAAFHTSKTNLNHKYSSRFEGAHVNTKARNIRKLICFHQTFGAQHSLFINKAKTYKTALSRLFF